MTSGFGLFFENTFSSFLEEKVGHNKQVHVFFFPAQRELELATLYCLLFKNDINVCKVFL